MKEKFEINDKVIVLKEYGLVDFIGFIIGYSKDFFLVKEDAFFAEVKLVIKSRVQKLIEKK